MIVRRVGPMSLAKVAGLLYALIGLIFGAIFALVSVLSGVVQEEEAGPVSRAIFGVGAIIFLPLFYGGLGFVFSLLGAALYNWTAGLLGGIEIQVAEAEPRADTTRGV